MTYENTLSGTFLSRPNRFIANVTINGVPEVCHVKNTGRCKELLLPGAEVILQRSDNPARKTKYDLIAVLHEGRYVNIDSVAPNAVFGEWLRSGGLGTVPDYIKPEHRYKNSRFDFYFECGEKKAYAEVKGVTLDVNGTALFPDAPTERGARHLRELADCVRSGYDAWAVFIIAMKGPQRLCPNNGTDPRFATALREAAEAGVKLLALDCSVTENSITADRPVMIVL